MTTSCIHAPLQHLDLGEARIAYRCVGDGPPLLLIHGWPFDARPTALWSRVWPPHFRCYLPDTPGLGVSEWTARTDFSLPGQAATIGRLIDALGLGTCAILAHDTGATIARLLAAREPRRVRKLVLLNTEMPGHRPPWIPLYRRVAALPGAASGFALAMRQPAFIRSPLGFGGCFHDPARLDAAFVERVVAPLAPLARSRRRHPALPARHRLGGDRRPGRHPSPHRVRGAAGVGRRRSHLPGRPTRGACPSSFDTAPAWSRCRTPASWCTRSGPTKSPTAALRFLT